MLVPQILKATGHTNKKSSAKVSIHGVCEKRFIDQNSLAVVKSTKFEKVLIDPRVGYGGLSPL